MSQSWSKNAFGVTVKVIYKNLEISLVAESEKCPAVTVDKAFILDYTAQLFIEVS